MSEENFLDLLGMNESTMDEAASYMLIHSCIDNILNSYTDFSDSFAEIIQNSFDSLLEKIKLEEEFTPRIYIKLEEESKKLEIRDNGIGISSSDFKSIFRPNFSLKKLKKHKQARGHKGAATTYLQFAHSRYEIYAKFNSNTEHLLLENGDDWVKAFNTYIERESNDQPPSQPNWRINNEEHPWLDSFETGCVTSVNFSNLQHKNLFDSLLTNKEKTVKRVLHLFLTRTAIGYISTANSSMELPEELRGMRIELEINFSDGTTKSDDVEVGHLYPHQIASDLSKTVSTFSSMRTYSEVIWKCWTNDNLKEIFFQNDGSLQDNQEVLDILNKYNISGYSCYSYNNELYEKMVQQDLSLDPTERSPNETLLYEYIIDSCTNAGWKMSVMDYPNGNLFAFKHRGGSEARSRLFCIWNFSDPFKPDYGRKSYPIEVKPFVITMTKHLMAKMQNDTKDKIKKDRRSAPRGATVLSLAKQQQIELQERIKADRQGTSDYLSSGGEVSFVPSVATELEVQDFFLSLIKKNQIKGYSIPQINDSGINDMFFSYKADDNEEFRYHETDNKLGLVMQGSVNYDDLWIEFKVSLSSLIQELNAAPDTPGKKWWELINLVVVSSLDGGLADGSYILRQIDGTNVDHRLYFGATHTLTSPNNESILNLIDLSEYN